MLCGCHLGGDQTPRYFKFLQGSILLFSSSNSIGSIFRFGVKEYLVQFSEVQVWVFLRPSIYEFFPEQRLPHNFVGTQFVPWTVPLYHPRKQHVILNRVDRFQRVHCKECSKHRSLWNATIHCHGSFLTLCLHYDRVLPLREVESYYFENHIGIPLLRNASKIDIQEALLNAFSISNAITANRFCLLEIPPVRSSILFFLSFSNSNTFFVDFSCKVYLKDYIFVVA